MIHFPKNYSNYYLEKAFPRASDELEDFNDDESNNKQQVKIHGDNSNYMITGEINREIYDTLKRVGERVDKIAEGIEIPIKYADPPVYGREPAEFEDFMFPGILLFLVFGTAFGLAQITLLPERKEGLVERSRSAGVKPYQIILAYVISQIGVLIIQTLFRLLIAFYVFNIPLRGSFMVAYFLIILQGICGMSFGIWASSCFKDEQEALFFTMPLFFLMMLSGGIFTPIESMPPILQKLSLFLPQTYSCIAIRSIIARGWGLADLTILLAFFSSGLWTFILIGISVFMLRFNL